MGSVGQTTEECRLSFLSPRETSSQVSPRGKSGPQLTRCMFKEKMPMLQPDLTMDLDMPVASLTFRFSHVPSGCDTSWTH